MRNTTTSGIRLALLVLVSLVAISPAPAETLANPLPLTCRPMDNQRLQQLIMGIDSGAMRRNNLWQFQVKGLPMLVITDTRANRFRAMTQVRAVEELAPDEMVRLMQANFDSALDARYALQGGQVWSTFVHPLDSLTEPMFRFGLDQVVNLVETFGDTYSSGAIMFRGGDSPAIEQEKQQSSAGQAL